VHPGFPGLEHVLQALPKKLPPVVVVRPALGAGDHDPLGALRLEHRPHRIEILEIGLDALPLIRLERVNVALGSFQFVLGIPRALDGVLVAHPSRFLLVY
jgi:hypothetical protein